MDAPAVGRLAHPCYHTLGQIPTANPLLPIS